MVVLTLNFLQCTCICFIVNFISPYIYCFSVLLGYLHTTKNSFKYCHCLGANRVLFFIETEPLDEGPGDPIRYCLKLHQHLIYYWSDAYYIKPICMHQYTHPLIILQCLRQQKSYCFSFATLLL